MHDLVGVLLRMMSFECSEIKKLDDFFFNCIHNSIPVFNLFSVRILTSEGETIFSARGTPLMLNAINGSSFFTYSQN